MFSTHSFQSKHSAGLVNSVILAASLIAFIGLAPVQAHGAERHFELGSFTAPAGAKFAQTVSPGSFLDVYSFEFISSDSGQGVIGAALSAVGITDLMVGLWSNGSEIVASNAIVLPNLNLSTFTDLQTNSFYELRVSGNASDPYGGAYGGVFGMAAVSPAPEPEVYAMMAIGIAVVGWAGRRKRKHQALASA